MRCLIACLWVAAIAGQAWGAQTLRSLEPEPERVEGVSGKPNSVNVLTVSNPRVTTRTFAVTGRVRYGGVAGRGMLEMWSHFPDGKAVFTRTLGSGLMAPLAGDCQGRRFSLPLFMQGDVPPPSRLVVNVVLPAGGWVELSDLELVQYGDGEDPLRMQGSWWSDRQGGLLGGIAGSVLGLLGALIGGLCYRGRGQRVVLGLAGFLLVVGLVSSGAGAYALIDQQPYGVVYPLLLLGGLAAATGAILIPVTRRRFSRLELRKMQSMDA